MPDARFAFLAIFGLALRANIAAAGHPACPNPEEIVRILTSDQGDDQRSALSTQLSVDFGKGPRKASIEDPENQERFPGERFILLAGPGDCDYLWLTRVKDTWTFRGCVSSPWDPAGIRLEEPEKGIVLACFNHRACRGTGVVSDAETWYLDGKDGISAILTVPTSGYLNGWTHPAGHTFEATYSRLLTRDAVFAIEYRYEFTWFDEEEDSNDRPRLHGNRALRFEWDPLAGRLARVDDESNCTLEDAEGMFSSAESAFGDFQDLIEDGTDDDRAWVRRAMSGTHDGAGKTEILKLLAKHR